MSKLLLSTLFSATLLLAPLLISSGQLYAEEMNGYEQEGEQKTKPDNDKENPLDNVDINIIRRDNKTIETHSINGVIYKVKIKPDNAPAYYFYDTDGDGSLDKRSTHDISVQQWKIFEW